MPLSVVEAILVPTRLSLSLSSMVSSSGMEKRSSFQATMKSRGLEIWPESLVRGDEWDEFRQ